MARPRAAAHTQSERPHWSERPGEASTPGGTGAAFDPIEAMIRLGEFFRWIAPPPGESAICEHGLATLSRPLGAVSGVMVLKGGGRSSRENSRTRVAAVWGTAPSRTLIESARAAIRGHGDRSVKGVSVRNIEESIGGSPNRPAASRSLLVLPLLHEASTIGAVALECASLADPGARSFAETCTRAISAALSSSRRIGERRLQGEMLVRRNAELEALRELGGRMQHFEHEEDMLQAALDLILERLGLGAGWIFWGDAASGRMQLAASHGISASCLGAAPCEGIAPGSCADAFELGRPAISAGRLEHAQATGLACGLQPMTHACVPLKFERGVLGVMNVANRPGRFFTQEELGFLETVGHQLCLAVDKARTAKAENRRNAEARALALLSRAIGGSLDQQKVLAAVGEYARELIRADRCAIFLGADASSLSFAYLSGAQLEGLETGHPSDLEAIGARSPGEAFRHGRTVVFDNAFEDSRANHDLARRWGIGSLILVPLRARERAEGLLMVTREAPSRWTRDEVELTDALAGQAALAIETSRLYREAQEALLRMQQAQYLMMRAERLAAVGTLASSLAHEVRNPLNSISLQLVLLERRMAGLSLPVRTEVLGLLETAKAEIARLDTLVEEFLSLSSIDRLTPVPTPPGQLIEEVMILMTPLARERGIAVAVVPDEKAPWVRLDREKMKQVLINLVRNAIEAMPEGGTLTVGASHGARTVFLNVSDTGIGIPPGQDVYDFFVTTKRGGTGLGLPIARRIVEAHGGSLKYESRPGEGTVFTISLAVPDHDPGGGVERRAR